MGPERSEQMLDAVAGIVLAAGEGRSFGGPKALVRFGGRTLVERAIRTLADGGCRPVVVVLGAAAAEIRRSSDLADAVVVVNPAWSEGMGGSLRIALGEARTASARAAVVVLVDQPLVTSALVGRLIDAWRAGASVAVARRLDLGRCLPPRRRRHRGPGVSQGEA